MRFFFIFQGTVTYFFDDTFKRRKYTGDWKNGTRWGEGTTVWRNGTVYTGSYVNGWEQGLGSLKSDKSPRIYQGEFVGGQKHGKGVVTQPDGRRLKGTWSKGRIVGNLTPLLQELPQAVGEIKDLDLTEKLLSQVDQKDIENSPGFYSRDINEDDFRFIEILRRTDSRFGRKSRSVTKQLLQRIYDHVNKITK